MRAVIQRCSRAEVTVGDKSVGRIGHGLVVLVGVQTGDSAADAEWLAGKVAGLRIFSDAAGKMNLDLAETGGSVLAISQFTLLGDARRGRRPSFVAAAEPEAGNRLYETFVASLRQLGLTVETGIFQAEMQVSLTNDGPVTILLDSRRLF